MRHPDTETVCVLPTSRHAKKTEQDCYQMCIRDRQKPNWEDFQGFLKGEVRYASAMKQYPTEAEELFKAAQENANWRYNSYKRLARENWGAE